MGAQCIPCCYNSIHWYNLQNSCSVQFICPGSNRFSKPWNNSSTAYLSEPWRHSAERALLSLPCLQSSTFIHPLSPLTLDMTSSLSLPLSFFTVDSLTTGFRNYLCTNEWMDGCLLMLTETISSHILHRQAVWKFVECGTDIIILRHFPPNLKFTGTVFHSSCSCSCTTPLQWFSMTLRSLYVHWNW